MWGGQLKIQKAQGFATLFFTLVVLLSITTFAFISAQSVVTHQHTVLTHHEKQSSFDIAQAGLDYAVPYLTANYATITNASSTRVNMPDGGYASLQFTFVGDKNTIRVTSTGYTADGVVSSSAQQLVKYKTGSVTKTFAEPVIAAQGLRMSGTSPVSFITGNNSSLVSALLGVNSVSISSGSYTSLNGVNISTSGHTGSDIIINPSMFTGQTSAQLETSELGQTIAQFGAVTTQGSMSGSGATSMQPGSNGTNVITLMLPASAFAPYSSWSSMTLQSTINVVLGGSATAPTLSPISLGTAQKPVNLVINLVAPAPNPANPPQAKIYANSVIYGNVIVNGGNLMIDSAARVYGDVIVENGTTIIEPSTGVVAAGLPTVTGAILSTGDVSLLSSSVNGLIYTDGNLIMSSALALSGSARSAAASIVTGGAYSGKQVQLTNSSIGYNSGMASITISGSGTAGYGKVAGSWTDN